MNVSMDITTFVYADHSEPTVLLWSGESSAKGTQWLSVSADMKQQQYFAVYFTSTRLNAAKSAHK